MGISPFAFKTLAVYFIERKFNFLAFGVHKMAKTLIIEVEVLAYPQIL